MNRYENIINNFVLWGNKCGGLYAAMIIGSWTRNDHVLNGQKYNTRHNGRFIEEWAEDWIIQKLSDCYAHYEKNDVKNSLVATMDLFRSIAVVIAEKLNYKYPVEADNYSTDWVLKALSADKLCLHS